TAKIRLEQKLDQLNRAGYFTSSQLTLTEALNSLTTGANSQLGQISAILKTISDAIPQSLLNNNSSNSTQTQSSPNPYSLSPILHPTTPQPPPLFAEIASRLSSLNETINNQIQNKVTNELASSFAELDRLVLAPYKNYPAFQWRWENYLLTMQAGLEFRWRPNTQLIGTKWIALSYLLQALDNSQNNLDNYDGPLTTEFLSTTNYFLQRIRTDQTNLFIQNYLSQAREALLRIARFPLFWPPGPPQEALDEDQLRAARSLLDAIWFDLQAPTFQKIPPISNQSLLSFVNRLQPLFSVFNALLDSDGNIRSVTITLYNGQAQKQLSGPNFAPLPTPTPTPIPSPTPSSVFYRFFSGPQPTPEPPPPTIPFYENNWNAISLNTPLGQGPVFPLSSTTDVVLGTFSLRDSFSFSIYHSLLGGEATNVDGGQNWSALRLLARLQAKPLGIGQDWQVALRPNEPIGVWLNFHFQTPLPINNWPTIDALGLREFLTPTQDLPTTPPPQPTQPPT
ncbi:MAG: hypothetical protein NZL93_04180, partial [Chthoniobacterales bacterium]|nr:hypothetical protein [Chthoniobacterales bacterium]